MVTPKLGNAEGKFSKNLFYLQQFAWLAQKSLKQWIINMVRNQHFILLLVEQSSLEQKLIDWVGAGKNLIVLSAQVLCSWKLAGEVIGMRHKSNRTKQQRCNHFTCAQTRIVVITFILFHNVWKWIMWCLQVKTNWDTKISNLGLFESHVLPTAIEPNCDILVVPYIGLWLFCNLLELHKCVVQVLLQPAQSVSDTFL